MEVIYKLDENGKRIYKKRLAIKLYVTIIAIQSAFILFFVLFNAPKELYTNIGIKAVLIIAVFILWSNYVYQKRASAIRWKINDERVGFYYDKQELGDLLSFLMNRFANQGKTNAYCEIDFRFISKIVQKKNKLVIYSYGYDFLTKKGTIEIPNCLSKYDEILTTLKNKTNT